MLLTCVLLAACSSTSPGRDPASHDCVVTPNDLVECSEVSGA